MPHFPPLRPVGIFITMAMDWRYVEYGAVRAFVVVCLPTPTNRLMTWLDTGERIFFVDRCELGATQYGDQDLRCAGL
ncbi:MAG TPA: hypothetical protein PKK23_16200 [Nitrospirales bacterium]|nr:hypothetical protein [Nitrospiraceae bacterium]HNP30588.1 hypothetical protein [Nitrospirales bacterium]